MDEAPPQKGNSVVVQGSSAGELTRVEDNLHPLAARFTLPSAASRSPGRPWWRSSIALSLAALVVLPALMATIYYVFIASDQYTVESRFVVRQLSQTLQTRMSTGSGNANGKSDEQESNTSDSRAAATNSRAAATATATARSSTQIMPGEEDAYIVTSYIRSRAIIDDLLKMIDLRTMYRPPEADFLARLKDGATIEELEDYWLDKVSASADPLSGIVVVTIRAFRPDDALVIAQTVNTLCAQLVDDISRRARHDALVRANAEVRRAETNFRAELAEMETFRDREGLINPVKSGGSTEFLINQLIKDRIDTENEIFALKRLSPQSIRLGPLTARVDAINARVAELRARLTGHDGATRTIAASLATFEELSTREKVAEQMYTSARDGAERARLAAERRWVFLSVFVPPRLPEESRYPRRIAFSVLVFVGLFVVWSIGAVACASIRDHLL